ncbi:class F sortase [Nocardiopsis halophila]|uniref:class F sortase n=1 Tax=Nocardiopsis halophila TaxID=141692 RepID=UPI00034D9D6F|nr:class F sortase [Nocardiopsis halophila]
MPGELRAGGAAAALAVGAAAAAVLGGAFSAPSGPEPLTRSAPVALAVDAIGVRARVLEMGLGEDGAMEDPPLEDAGAAGWYALGPAPGEAGPAVITGHRDTATGPSVFLRLEELRPGDRFTVRREDGTAPEFEVERTKRVGKDAFPAEEVYGPGDRPEIRLITCAGDFDPATGHYEENLIVFGRMVE